MLDLNSIDSREDFKWDLITRAFKDPGFGQLLKENPRSVLEEELGKDAARNVDIAVHQETPREIFFLINYNPNLPEKAGQITINPNDTPEAVLVKKAWKDPQYRQELLHDPGGKFEREFGRPMPGSTSLTVLDESRDHLHLILPAVIHQQQLGQGATNPELSEAELQHVSGGGFFSWLGDKLGIRPVAQTGGSCSSASGVRG